jgi:transposase
MANPNRVIGIDLSKSSMEVAILMENDLKLKRKSYKTTKEGQSLFINMLEPTDVIGLETGNGSFVLAKQIIKKVGCKVHVLNAGKLHVIFDSMKKTDKQDAINIAKFVARTPEEELPTVNIPSDEEMRERSSITEYERIGHMKNQSVNALHNLFWNQGITDITKKELKDSDTRKKLINHLPAIYNNQANRIIEQIELFEKQQAILDEEHNQMLKANDETTKISMSMPGMGPKATLALHAWLGDMSRFSSGRQVAYFVGIVPKVDNSGNQIHYGSITKMGPSQIRRVLNQAAWAAIRSKQAEPLVQFYHRIRERRGKGRAICAVQRKMLEILYVMHTSKTLFNPSRNTEALVQKKLKYYKLISKS